MLGRLGKRLRGQGSRSEELPDCVRDFEGEEDRMDEGEEFEEGPVGNDPMSIPDQVVFVDLAKDLPPLPKPRSSRNKKLTLCNDPEEINREYYCSFRFINHRAHRDALTDPRLNRKGTPERVFPMSDKMPDSLIDIYERENLNNWFKIVSGKTSATLVREIVSNTRHWQGGEAKDSRHIYCRGKFFVLTPEVISLAIGFAPLSAPCAYQRQLESHECLREVSRFCFGEKQECWERRNSMPRWKVDKNALVLEARWVCELLENWVLGITPQPTYTFKLCTLAFCVYSGARVDIPWFIYESLMERKNKECEKGPGHGYLLQTIVKKQGVVTTGVAFDIPAPPDRKYEKILGAVEDKPVKARGAKGKGKDKEAGSSSGTPSDLAATLARMERKMDSDRAERDRQFEHTRENQRKLGAILETLGKWHMSEHGDALCPHPPTSSPWYDSEGYEYPHPDQDDE